LKASPGVSWRSNRSSLTPPGIPRERGRPTHIHWPSTHLPPPIPGWPQPAPSSGVLRQGAPACREMPLFVTLAIAATGSRQPSPLGSRPASVQFFRQPPCRRAPHHPGGRGAMTPFPVDRSGANRRSFAKVCAVGTPALPGGRRPMPASPPCAKMASVKFETGPFLFRGTNNGRKS